VQILAARYFLILSRQRITVLFVAVVISFVVKVLVLCAKTFLRCIMTYFTSWEDFAKAAEMLYINDPMKVL